MTTSAGPLTLHIDPPDRRLEVVHHHDERGVWATRGRRILFRPPQGDWREIARFPSRGPRDWPIALRPASRLLRGDRCSVFPARKGGLLGMRGGVVYRFDEGRPVRLFEIRGHCVMHRAIAEASDGSLLFGEYVMNWGHEPVRIFRVAPDLDDFEVVYTFRSPHVFHVHSVHADPFEPGRVWVCTGDYAGQCFLVEADERFETVRFRGDGTQLWRMVGLLFQRDRLCWATDSHLETNHVVTMDRASGEIALHGERDASTWFTAETADGLYLATTGVEPGPAIRTRESRLLVSRDGVAWHRVGGFEKDFWPMPAFGLGVLRLPSGRYASSSFWLNGDALEGLDGAPRHCSLAEST